MSLAFWFSWMSSAPLLWASAAAASETEISCRFSLLRMSDESSSTRTRPFATSSSVMLVPSGTIATIFVLPSTSDTTIVDLSDWRLPPSVTEMRSGPRATFHVGDASTVAASGAKNHHAAPPTPPRTSTATR